MTKQYGNKATIKMKSLTSVVGALLAVQTGSALAQEKNESGSQESEVIVITAQKRTQNLMEVPLAIDVLSAEDISDTGSALLGDLADYTPGFSFSKNDVVQSTATMRGISSSDISTGGDPSVAIFFDDFYMPRAAQSVLFSDIERIEVLKGPQGTLFGKNAAAGVVSIIPKAPSSELEGFVKARVGDYALRRVEGMLNVPLADNVALRFNAMTNQRDSFVDNINNDYQGEELGNRSHLAARASLLWTLSEQTSLQLSYDWDDLDQGYRANIGVSEYAYGFDVASRKMESDVTDGHEWRDMSAFTLKLEHEFDENWSAKFISGFREWEVSGRDDVDGTSDISRYVDTINYENSDIFYNELQINYTKDKLSYVGGLTYSKEGVLQNTSINVAADTVTRLATNDLNATLVGGLQMAGYDMDTINTLGLPTDHIWQAQDWASILSVMSLFDPSVGDLFAALGVAAFTPELVGAISQTGDMTYDALAAALGVNELLGPSYSGQLWGEDITNTGDFTSYGLYSDVDYQINKQWGIAVGLRYSHDEKDFSWAISERPLDGRSLPGILDALYPELPQINASDSWSKLTGRILTRYQLDDSQLLYASYSTGYKAGGYDSLDPNSAFSPFEPEEVSDLEIGYKADLFDNQLRVQANVFVMDVTNRQRGINSQQPDSEALKPIVINGDQDINGIELILDWNATNSLKLGLITELRSTDSKWEPFYNSEGELVTESDKSDSATAYTLKMDWLPEISDLPGYWKVHVDYVFEQNIAEDDINLMPVAYLIPGYFNDTKNLNARISWTSEDDQWEVALWAKNILDNATVGTIQGLAAEILGTPTTLVNDPRTIGIDLNYHF